MRNLRKLGSALVFAGVVSSAMMIFSTTLHAAGPGTGASNGYCRVLAAAIEETTDLGLTDLAAYLQSIFNAYCS